MDAIQDLLNDLHNFEATAEGYAEELRLDLSGIIAAELRERNWSQARLAKEAGMKASYINRLIHGASNCTFEVAARVLFTLQIRPQLAERRTEVITTVDSQEVSHGKEEEWSGWTGQVSVAQYRPRNAHFLRSTQAG